MDLSTPTHAVTEAAARPVGRDDAWVREKGLPPLVPGSLVDQLGGTLLLATDLSDESREANARAMELAECASLPLLILAIDAPSTNTARPGRIRLSKRPAALVNAAHQREIDAEGRLLTGDPASTILPAASGVVRNATDMDRALGTLDEIRSVLPSIDVRPSEEGWSDLAQILNLHAMLGTAEATLRGAIAREETRGAHIRSDYPDQDPALEVNFIVRPDGEDRTVAEPRSIPAVSAELTPWMARVDLDPAGRLLE